MVYPLEGIKVLDFSIAVAAPFGAAMLADMGAEVIKVERVQGEAQRLGLPAGMDEYLETDTAGANDKADWMAFNRGKKDLAVDIRHEKGREIALKLAERSDVIIQSFRPGVAERLGIGYEAISRINPKVIYCSFYGYGESGPVAHRAGGDMWSQAMSGMVSVLGYPGGAPTMVPFPLCDHLGGVLVAYAVMTALFVRERTGTGQAITVNNLDAALYLQFSGFSEYLAGGRMPYKEGRSYQPPPFGPFRAKDGDVMTIFGTGPMWRKFCEVVGVPHLADDPRFATDEARFAHREEIGKVLDEAFSKKTRAEWVQVFREAKMRCDPCLTYEEVCAHPQLAANETICTVEHPLRGEIKMLGLPVKLKKTPGRPQGPAPLLGQHTEEILLALGYTKEEITRLEREGVIRTRRIDIPREK
ncbi:MAG: CoA transferase [Dehalococcoidales bacterium]|nr:CoA transferase [Dehalococcoidales bacterium]